MTGTPTPEEDATQQARVENTLLRGRLWLTTRSLKDYLDAPQCKIEQDGEPMVQVTVTELVQSKTARALADAQRRLREGGRS